MSMTVAELIAQLRQLPQDLEVATGFPVVAQGPDHMSSLCSVDAVEEVNLRYETWMGNRFALIKVWPEFAIACA
jgi:hypothetical protein